MKKLIAAIIAIATTCSCTVGHYIAHGGPDGKDYVAFAQDTIKRGNTPFHFATEPNSELSEYLNNLSIDRTTDKGDSIRYTFEEYIREVMFNEFRPTIQANDMIGKKRPKRKSGGTFMIIENDTIKYSLSSSNSSEYEDYLVYSITKSLTSLLCGIAIDKGYIESVNDPVTKYIPELSAKNPTWDELTIEHLLEMRSGLNIEESYGINPFAKLPRLFCTRNQFRMIEKLGFYAPPGSDHQYRSVTTAVLGTVLERAIGCPIAKFATKEVWQQMGMERDGYLSLDSKRNRDVKSFMGLTTNSADLAKLGRLYLNQGNWNGQQIVSRKWVERSTHAKENNRDYSYQWWMGEGRIEATNGKTLYATDSLTIAKRAEELQIPAGYVEIVQDSDNKWYGKNFYQSGQFYALGMMDQIVYVDQQHNLLVVRMGIDNTNGKVDEHCRVLVNELMKDYFKR